MDIDWAAQMSDQAHSLIGIMKAHDDEGIGAAAQLEGRIQRIFDLVSCGETSTADSMIQALNDAKEAITQDQHLHFDGAKRDLDGWSGSAADGFFDYLNQLEDGVELMKDRIDAMILIITAHAALVKGMRSDVVEFVRHTLDGIAEAATDGWKVGAAIVGAVVGVAGAVVGTAAGGPLGVVAGTIAASMVAGATSVAVEAKGADSELGVIVEFVDSGEGMLELVDIERAKIERAFRELAAAVTGDKLSEVRPARPMIITAPDFHPGTFGLSQENQGRHRVPQDTRDLVPEPSARADGPFDGTTGADGQHLDRYSEQGPSAT
ncbi:hypothetical protein [Actinokineospora iranica]|uniref:Uncharacterized protein n=1 Tax=Actinokineospora iranica TaxID=1271860 RepID=A0A1G6SPZ3_9PSEU|nr:hypothetical protein [Actinokineospora iranica]SDD18940.1 hypothetical protein SAMN05216174_108107 [Actinokineospora iranica]